MSITTEADLRGLRKIGRIVAEALGEMRRNIRPGVTTAELDDICARVLARNQARPTPEHEYGFPGASCISVNDEVVHGIPGRAKIAPGDVVKIDVTADCDGYVADAARTVVVPGGGEAADERARLAACARSAFELGLDRARAGHRAFEIGRAIENETSARGFSVVRALFGHGVGRKIHEPPSIPNYDEPECDHLLTDGLVVTVEPLVTLGSGEVYEGADGWTVRTLDGTMAAHYEETIVVTGGRPLILTREPQAA